MKATIQNMNGCYRAQVADVAVAIIARAARAVPEHVRKGGGSSFGD